MGIKDKILKAYFNVAESIDSDEKMIISSRLFHRNKKYAFFVEVRRLDENGCLEGEIKIDPFISSSFFHQSIWKENPEEQLERIKKINGGKTCLKHSKET